MSSKLRAAWTPPPPGTGKLIALERDEFLSIRNGRGVRVRALSGILWITESGSSADHVLRPGDEIDCARAGTTIVSAARAARLVVETVAGRARPDAIEKVHADGRRAAVEIGTQAPGAIATWIGAIAGAIAGALVPINAIAKRIGEKHYSPMTGPDAYPPRQPRRRAKNAARRVEHAVIDQWLMWRH